MNTDGLHVNHAGLEAAAADLRSSVARIDDRLSRLDQELAPLRADWVGEAQTAYRAAKASWDSALQEMRGLLDQTSRAVTESNAEYLAADRRGAVAFDQ